MCRSSGPTAPVAPSERLDDVRAVDCGGAGLAELTGRQLHGDDPAVGDRAAGQVHAAGKALAAEDARPLADRKSTRLNSSHVAISYAVFCLKKKYYQHV